MLARRPGTQETPDGVRDAKVRMDRYFESEAARDAPLRDAVRAALRYHQSAATAVGRPTTLAEQLAIGRDPALEQCPKLKEFLAGFGKAAAPPTTDEEAKNRGIAVIGFVVRPVCAARPQRPSVFSTAGPEWRAPAGMPEPAEAGPTRSAPTSQGRAGRPAGRGPSGLVSEPRVGRPPHVPFAQDRR